jgi:hypothetical protein
MILIASFLACAVRGHRWDVAPAARRAAEMECVRCGLRAATAHGL